MADNHAASQSHPEEKWLHLRAPGQRRSQDLAEPDQQPSIYGRQFHQVSHWANHMLKQAGLPKAF
jgi:hypothetical protein